MVMKGFRLLEATCKDLTRKIADSEKIARSTKQAYAALEEKARVNEAYYKEQISKREDEVRSYEASLAELVTEAQEKMRIDAATYTTAILQMEERLQARESACFELVEKMKECESALEDRKSVCFMSWTQKLDGINDIYPGS